MYVFKELQQRKNGYFDQEVICGLDTYTEQYLLIHLLQIKHYLIF